MTLALIAFAAMLAALLVVAMLSLAGRRTRIETDERIARALDEMGERMDKLSHELSGTLDRVHTDGALARAIAQLGNALELDEVLARIADAALALEGADAVVVRTTAGDGRPILAVRGVPADEAQAQIVVGPPDGTEPRAVGVSFVYRTGLEPPGALRSGVAVPLLVDAEPDGFVAVYSHDPTAAPGEHTVARLEELAVAGGAALTNARRFEAAQQLEEIDALTGLPNRRSFHGSLSREVARAHRYGRRLALLMVDIDSFKGVNARVGQLGGDEALVQVADRIREVLHEADVAFRVGGDEFAVVLPESGRIDAEGLFARAQAALRRPPAEPEVTLSGGIAELASGDDAVSLLEQADEALYRAKVAGKGTAA